MKLHAHVAGLLPILDHEWRRRIWIGGLVLCIPFLGWPAVLGYRAAYVRHLFAPLPAPLPVWRGQFWAHVIDGLRAMAVIFGHLAPLYFVTGWLAMHRGFVPGTTAGWLLLAFAAFPIFSTLSLPVSCALLAHDGWLSQGEAAAVVVAFAALVFVIPAGFLQVSCTGRFRSAFAVWRSVPFVWRHLAAYTEAWLLAGAMSLAGHLCLPLAPWGVVWCYLAILSLFNEVLLVAGCPPGSGWLQRGLAEARLQARREIAIDVRTDGAGRAVRSLELRLFAAPLPG